MQTSESIKFIYPYLPLFGTDRCIEKFLIQVSLKYLDKDFWQQNNAI